MSLQRGMNFSNPPGHSVLLSSHREGAPYEDRLEENGTVLIHEGHDEVRSVITPNPKSVDQPLVTRTGRLTQNGHFNQAAQAYQRGEASPAEVRVYEKIKPGIWSYNGRFALLDSWTETARSRRVFRFRLSALADSRDQAFQSLQRFPQEQNRIIPSKVKLAVWKRDKGMCVLCHTTTNLHFDHVLPYSKGGSSEVESNIQLLCVRHNLSKGARIQ